MIKSVRLCAFADEAGNSTAEQIAALKRNGIRLIELRNADGVNVADMTLAHAKRIGGALSEAGIGVWSIGSPIGKIGVDEDFVEHRYKAERVFRIARLLECDKVRVFSFFTAAPDADRATVVRRLRELVGLAADYGIELYHENEKDIYGDIPRRVEILAAEVSGLKTVYDPANYIQCGVRTEESLPLARGAGYLHIKDARFSGEVVPAGEGEGNIRGLLEIAEGDKVLTIEPHLRVFDGYGAIDSHEMKNIYSFPSGAQAFDCAAAALKKILRENYREEDGIWKR